MEILLSIGMLMGAVLTAGSVAFFGIWLWDVYLKNLLLDAKENKNKVSIIVALRGVFLSRLTVFNARFFSKKYQTSIEKSILYAGSPSELEPLEFIGLQEISLAAWTFFGFLITFLFDISIFWTLLFSGLGWGYPWIWLNDLVNKRQRSITRALPYNLDLLTLSVEAGLDFAQAVGKVCEKGKQGPLVDEFKLLLRNVKMGKTREESLRMMGDRVGTDSMQSFVNALIQADKMGSSLGKILRIQSAQLRLDRTNRAEKMANEAPVKMLLPLIGFIFPTVFLILFSPIVFQMIFNPQM